MLIEIWDRIWGEGRRTCWSGGCFLQFWYTGSPPLSSQSLPLTHSLHFSGIERVFSDSCTVNRVPRWCRDQWTPVLHAAIKVCMTMLDTERSWMWTDASWLQMTVRLHFYFDFLGFHFTANLAISVTRSAKHLFLLSWTAANCSRGSSERYIRKMYTIYVDDAVMVLSFPPFASRCWMLFSSCCRMCGK